jgi:hypothetical protein
VSLFDLADPVVRTHVNFDVAFFGQRGARRRFDREVDAAEDGRVGGSVSVGCGAVSTREWVKGEGDGHFGMLIWGAFFSEFKLIEEFLLSTWLSKADYILYMQDIERSPDFDASSYIHLIAGDVVVSWISISENLVPRTGGRSPDAHDKKYDHHAKRKGFLLFVQYICSAHITNWEMHVLSKFNRR